MKASKVATLLISLGILGGGAFFLFKPKSAKFYDTAFDSASGRTGFVFKTDPGFKVGNRVKVSKDNKAVNAHYDNTWEVQSVSTTLVPGAFTVIVHYCPWGTNTSNESGKMILVK